MSKKLVVLDLNDLLVFPIYPAIEYPTYDDVMKGGKILNGECLIIKRDYLTEFLDFLFENFKVGIWSESKDKDYINEVLEVLNIRNKVEFIYSLDDSVERYIEVCGFGYETIRQKVSDKIKNFDKDDIIYVQHKKSKIICDSNAVYLKRFYSQEDDVLLKAIDFLTVYQQLEHKNDYKGDVEYSEMPF
jgi:hypothetical protein